MNLKHLAILACVPILVATALGAGSANIEPGLYLRTSYAFGNLSLNTIYVGPGNKIAIDPKHGIDPFDFEAAAKEAPNQVGTYKIEGKKIVVTWANKKVDRLEVEFTNGKFSAYDGGLITRADAYPKDKTLAATYAGAWRTRNVSSSFTITFSTDGKYSATGLGGVSKIPGNTGIAQKTVQGTYKLSGNTLVLKASSGEVTRHTVMPFSTALDPKKAKLRDDHMIFDSANLQREK
jgi:hypothetical protein